MALMANENFHVDAVAVDQRDRIADDLYERDAGNSNFVAFLLGGVVIAGGMLAFLYYDTGNLAPRDDLTTGSISRVEMPIQAPSIKIPLQPQQPGGVDVKP